MTSPCATSDSPTHATMTTSSPAPTTTPLVTVLLPVHNGCTPSPDALHASIQSILTQTLTSLHLVLVDDGSTDSTPAILSFYSLDARVTVLTHPECLGVAAALNTALTHCPPSPFLARMDADDVSHPSRLSSQVAYLASHPFVSVCGTAVSIQSSNSLREVALPTSPSLAGWAAAFYCPLAHPSVMWRCGVVPSYSTDPLHSHVEDLELWQRLIRAGVKVASLPPPSLLTLHRHPASASALHRQQQRYSALHLTREHVEGLTRHRVRFSAVEHLVRPGEMQRVEEAVQAAALLLLMETAWEETEGNEEDLEEVRADVTKRLGELAVLAMRLRGGKGDDVGVDVGDECGVEGCAWVEEKREAVMQRWPHVSAPCVDASGLMGLWLKRSSGGLQSRELLSRLLT